ncbi:Gfo/Idh/MocA family protein [Ornithinimicrobium sp. Y1847]|uniref:Gfo/Idh/MocA family protein n=1 Tax=Ornithinimicrobium sp. Y1847 TaxID=3405419 RepID=UPI003B66CFF8
MSQHGEAASEVGGEEAGDAIGDEAARDAIGDEAAREVVDRGDLRIAVIGYGLRRNLARLAHRPGAGSVVSAVCDRSERARTEAVGELGPGLHVVSDVSELPVGELDAVMILTPDQTHAALATWALDQGLATFCEKPLTTSVDDADALLHTAYRTGTRLYVGHNMRHMPVVRQLRAIVASGEIGRVRAIWCRHFVGEGGDYYFKDWHAERRNVGTLLLQKGAHDLDVIHWLAGGYTKAVSGIGDLAVYGDVTDRRDNSDRLLFDWHSRDTWPPTAQRELNPVIDVEDISMLNLQLEGGVLASYQQCHFTPDYWRSYTIIGDAGRAENIGDAGGDQIAVWTSRHSSAREPSRVETIEIGEGGHGGADPALIAEFVRFAREGGATEVSAIAARQAVAAACRGAESIRGDGGLLAVPELDPELVAYFDRGQRR